MLYAYAQYNIRARFIILARVRARMLLFNIQPSTSSSIYYYLCSYYSSRVHTLVIVYIYTRGGGGTNSQYPYQLEYYYAQYNELVLWTILYQLVVQYAIIHIMQYQICRAVRSYSNHNMHSTYQLVICIQQFCS